MISISNVTYKIGGRELLVDASVAIYEGQRVGVVGRNGTGKSTLLKLINRELELDSGIIEIPANITTSTIKQHIEYPNESLIFNVVNADKRLQRISQQLNVEKDAQKLSELYLLFEKYGGYDAEARASIILSGLGFNKEQQQQAMKEFSGGWQMRVAIAAALFCNPDLLMLDEPTNHLDFESVLWLENYLLKENRTLLLVSHDIVFLNKVTNYTIHLENQTLEKYTGNYNQFEKLKIQKDSHALARYKKQMAQKSKMMQFVERFRAKASKAKQAQSKLKAIEKMDIVSVAISDRAAPIIFKNVEQLASPIVKMNDIAIGYGDKVVLENINLSINADDRIAFLGMNGNGKSTLIKLICGELSPLSGKISRDDKLRVGYFSQSHEENLDNTLSAYDTMVTNTGNSNETEIRGILGKFGFNKNKSDTLVANLSGGEKVRLLLALISYHGPHILLLDEPTNHLDIESRAALKTAINKYNGCVILVSHDYDLVNFIADDLWLVANKTCVSYDGDLNAYEQYVISQGNENNKASKDKVKQKDNKSKNSSQVSNVESKITSLNKQRQRLLENNEPEYKINQLDKKIKKLEQEWEALCNDN